MSFQANIENQAKSNSFFRQVLYTGKHSQVVLMSIPKGGDIGEETHETVDQILVFVQGKGEAVLEGEAKPIEKGDIVFVGAGMLHNFKNTGEDDLKLYTIYSPPNHPDGTVHKTKEEAEAGN